MNRDQQDTSGRLPTIPLIKIGSGSMVELVIDEPDRARDLIRSGRRTLTPAGLLMLDWYSKRWAHKSRNPYLKEIGQIAARLPYGAWFMNMAYEWGCSTGVGPSGDTRAPMMLRTLDWPFHGMGRNLVVAQQEGPAGVFFNITWPGYTGAITAMAPGRFAIAINQAPMFRRSGSPMPVDWLLNRANVFRTRHITPAHLVRQICERCPDFDSARRTLIETPISTPAFFSIIGTWTDHSAVIERLPEKAFVRTGPAAVTNHWQEIDRPSWPRGYRSEERLPMMEACIRHPVRDFDWLTEPILNAETRLAAVIRTSTSEIWLRGYERDGIATEDFYLSAARLA